MTEPDEKALRFQKHPPARASYNYEALADLLVDNPNKWTLAFRQDRYSIYVAIKMDKVPALLYRNGFRVITRRNSRTRPRIADIYLSYQPEHDQRRPEW